MCPRLVYLACYKLQLYIGWGEGGPVPPVPPRQRVIETTKFFIFDFDIKSTPVEYCQNL